MALDSLPPCGGSGLKCSGDIAYVSGVFGLPPCGGSGLKYYRDECIDFLDMVSLHAEGVD